MADFNVGDLVKVRVTFPINEEGCSAERFWVCVTENSEAVRSGRVDNHLLFSDDHGYVFGDNIDFTDLEIMDVELMN